MYPDCEESPCIFIWWHFLEGYDIYLSDMGYDIYLSDIYIV